MVKVPLELIWDEDPEDTQEKNDLRQAKKEAIVKECGFADKSAQTSFSELTTDQKRILYEKYYGKECVDMAMEKSEDIKKKVTTIKEVSP